MEYETLLRIHDKFKIPVELPRRMPIEIPNIGRVGLAGLFHELGFKVGAEVGVEQGTYSEALCKYNPGVKLYCIDAWQAYRGYRDHMRQEKLDRFYETTKALLAPYDATLIRKFSMDAVKDFEDRSLDFVYIDANHDLQNVINDISEWSKKVKIGGIIAGHDYATQRKPTNMHVVEAVNAYAQAYNIRPFFVLGAKAIVDGIIRDEARSWMFVNQDKPARGKHRD